MSESGVISKSERLTLKSLVGAGTIHSYKYIKKCMMAEGSGYINGKTYIRSNQEWFDDIESR